MWLGVGHFKKDTKYTQIPPLSLAEASALGIDVFMLKVPVGISHRVTRDILSIYLDTQYILGKNPQVLITRAPTQCAAIPATVIYTPTDSESR